MNPQGQPQSGRRKLGEILVGAGVVDELQLGTALGHQRQWGGRLGNILIDLHFIDDATLASTLAQQLGLRLIDLATEKIDLDVVRLVPQSLAERHNAFPVNYDPKSRESLTVAFSDPTNLAAVDEIRFQTGKTLRIVVAPEGQIATAIRRYYAGEDPEPTVTDGQAGDLSAEQSLADQSAGVQSSGLFGNISGDLAGPEEEELAELEPIPSESQIGVLNVRDLGLTPAPVLPTPPKARAGDPLAGFLEGAGSPRPAAMPLAPAPSPLVPMASTVAPPAVSPTVLPAVPPTVPIVGPPVVPPTIPIGQSPGTGLPQAFRSTPFLGSPPPPPGPPGGVPPVLTRSGVPAAPVQDGPEGPRDANRRRESDIFASVVDLSKKTVEGFIPPPDLLRSHSSTSLPAAPSAFATPPAADPPPGAAEQPGGSPQWELRPAPNAPLPSFTDTDVRGALQGLEETAGVAVLSAPIPLAMAVSETRVAQALARLLIEKGLIQESELLAKLAEKVS
jgi:type IV pilus assembly protein PilB